MRQAGRYLPEYRALRARAGGFCRVLSDPRSGGGGDPAAGAPLRHGCGDPVRRHPADRRRRSGQQLDFGEDGPVLDRLDESDGIGRLQPGRVSRRSTRFTRPCGACARGLAGRDGADRVRRGAVDRRDLYGRGRREPRFPSDSKLGLSRSRRVCRADRPDRRGDDRLSVGADRGGRRGGAAVRQLGRRVAGSASSSAGSSRRPGGSRPR